MKKILFVIAFVLFVGIPTTTHATTPECSTTENNIPANIGDPACYTSTSTTYSWSTQEFDYYVCVWVDTGCDYCKEVNGIGQFMTCSGSCPVGWYMYWAPVVSNTCGGSIRCGNEPGVHVGEGWDPVYKTVWHSSTTTTNTCHYLTVDTWSECDTVTGTQVATNVDQHSISGTDCDNLNEDTTRICGVCDTKTDGKGSGTAPGPEEDLCLYGTPYPVPPTLNTTTNMWEWSCLGDDGNSYDDDAVCSAPGDEDGKCAPGNPGAQGEYAWNAIEFRGELCEGGTPTISTDFDSALPMPVTSGSPTTVTWGCDHIGVGTSTATDACSASRLAPKPGVCGPDDQGEFDNISDLNESCCNPDSYPPCTTDNTFASPISQSGKSWNWTCNSSKNDGTDAVNCAAECIPEIDVNVSPNPFPLTENGVTVEVTVTKTGVCAGEYTCTVDGQGLNGNNKVIFNNLNSPKDIVIMCDGKTIDTIHIAGYCTARACNAQGTCQSTPVVSNSYNASACSSTCNSNADCTRGRMIETKP